MSKVLLVGSAPCILDQITKVKSNDYQVIAVINNWKNSIAKEIFSQNQIVPNYYFFSDWLYFGLGGNKVIDKMELNKIMCVPYNKKTGAKMNFLEEKGIKLFSSEKSKIVSEAGGCKNQLWPSTGMLALGYLFLEENVESVDLIGFSFFEGKTHYYDNTKFDQAHHSVKSEKKIYEYFKQNFKCNII